MWWQYIIVEPLGPINWTYEKNFHGRKFGSVPCNETLGRFSSYSIFWFWLNYLYFSLFEDAIQAAGIEFRSNKLWDAYIEWEKSQGNLKHVTEIYDRLIALPTLNPLKNWRRYVSFYTCKSNWSSCFNVWEKSVSFIHNTVF